MFGGAVGWLLGMGALAIPGIGPVVAAGPIMGALAGLGAGSVLGGLAGALTGMGVPDAEISSFRDFFPSTKEGEKDADELSREAAFTGKEGMSIKRFELQDLNFDPGLTVGTTLFFVEESQRGKPRCTTYKLDWKDFGGSWKRIARKDFRIVPCT